MKLALALLPCLLSASPEPSDSELLLRVKRVHVEKLGGGETAGHIRDMIISSLQRSGLFAVTENPDRADAVLRGSAEDLVFTDTFQSSEGINARTGVSTTEPGRSGSKSGSRRYAGVSIGDHESSRIVERKHEASASVRIVNKDGDVIWSTTQESLGAKFRGASADVADKIIRQLGEDYRKAQALLKK